MSLVAKHVSATGVSGRNGDSYATAYTFGEMLNQLNSGQGSGKLYNVWADGIYARPGNDTIATGGTALAPVFIRGCRVVEGDGYLGRDSSGVLLTDNMPRINYSSAVRLNASASWVFLESLDVAGAANTAIIGTSNDSAIIRCRATNSGITNGVFGVGLSNRSVLFDSDILILGTGNGFQAVSAGTASARIIGNRISVASSNFKYAINTSSTAVIAKNTIIGNGCVGILCNATTSAVAILDNTIIGCSTGISMVTGGVSLITISNNIITDNNGFGIQSSGSPIMLFNTRFRNNISGTLANPSEIMSNTSYGNVLEDSGGPETDYVDFASKNLKLKTTSPAAGSGTPYPASIGAFQFGPSEGGETSYSF